MPAYFATLAGLAALIMVGNLAVVGGWLYEFLPGFSSLRSTGRALFLFGFAAAGLAAFGLDRLLIYMKSADASKRKPVMWWLVGLTAVVVVALLFVMPLFYSQTLSLTGGQYGRLPRQ